MDINTAVLNRQGEALFNFMSMKHQNDKHIGDLTIGDFIEMCEALARIKKTARENYQSKNQKRKERLMRQINDNFEKTLSNGEPRSVINEYCRQLGIPNIPEYVDAINNGKEKRLVIISAAAAHFLTDRKLAELKNGFPKEQIKSFKRFLNETTGKRGELKIFKLNLERK
jgi:membrane-associated HD superfamily phosphohydrolase